MRWFFGMIYSIISFREQINGTDLLYKNISSSQAKVSGQNMKNMKSFIGHNFKVFDHAVGS